MAAASLDVNFKEELSPIEQWFKVLSEAERTAALYSLLQHSTQVQIRFFITILQQMARADPMTALLSPAVGGSMQSQMEAKLASINLKSPGLKSTMLGSPSARTFNISAMNRQSLTFDSSSSPLQMPPIPLATQATPPPHSPNSALNSTPPEKPHIEFLRRRSPRAESVALGLGSWPGRGAGQLPHTRYIHGAQVVPSAEHRLLWPLRWLSAFRSPRADGGTAPGGLDGLSPAVGDSWASMVNMPLLPMFQKTSSNNSNNG